MLDRHTLLEPFWQRLLGSRSMLVMLALAGMFFTLSVSGWLLWLDYRNAERQLEEELQDRARHLHGELRQSMESLYTLREVIRYADSLPAIVFEDVAGAALTRNSHVLALEWVPQVRGSERHQYESILAAGRVIEQLDDDGARYPAPTRVEHFPVRYVAPRDVNEALIGVDLAGRPKRLQALLQARDQGGLAMSVPVTLLQPSHAGEQGVVIALPVYRGRPETGAERRLALRGFVIAVVDVDRLVSRIFPDLGSVRWVQIRDPGATDAGVLMEHGQAAAQHHSVVLETFGGRTWELSLSSSRPLVSLDLLLLPVAALMVGTLLVIIVCGYLLLLQRRGEQVDLLVQIRTRELRDANERLASLSITDPLTGLANRRALDDYLALEWQRALRDRLPLSILLLDVDHFKRLNDTRGHPVGDLCLRELAGLMRAHFKRPADLVARYGGEEFAVVLPNTDGTVLEQANRFREALARHPMDIGGDETLQVTVSGGLATLVPATGQTPRDLIKLADQALYEAKGAGRNRIVAAGAG